VQVSFVELAQKLGQGRFECQYLIECHP
jgi:hypothetical protein